MWRTLYGLIAAGVLFSGGGAGMPDLVPPWPAASAVNGVPGIRVTFPSHSPFVLADAGGDNGADPPTMAVAGLFLPAEASPAAPVPAVILLHGAAGVLGAREITYARQLAAMGVAALVIDAFGARRDRAAGFIDRLIEITETMVLADAYAGLRYLGSLPEVDGNRVALIGFSYGGMVATYAAYAQVAERLAPDGERFAGHAAFYAPCIVTFERARATGAPLLMLYGGRDAIVDRGRCAETAAELRAGGARVEVEIYEEAHHQWDGAIRGPRTIGRNLAPCRFVVDANGTIRDGRWRFPVTSPLTRKLALALCVGREGYLIGRDDDVRAQSNARLARFLEEVLAVRSGG